MTIRPEEGNASREYVVRVPHQGTLFDPSQTWVVFDGRKLHCVLPFEGERYSLVFFSISTWKQGPKEQMPEGTVYPTESSLKYFNDMLAPARGGNGSILAAFGMKVKPQVLFWPRPNLIHLPRKLAASS